MDSDVSTPLSILDDSWDMWSVWNRDNIAVLGDSSDLHVPVVETNVPHKTHLCISHW